MTHQQTRLSNVKFLLMLDKAQLNYLSDLVTLDIIFLECGDADLSKLSEEDRIKTRFLYMNQLQLANAIKTVFDELGEGIESAPSMEMK